MVESWSKEQRDKVKTEIEEAIGIGEFRLRSVDAVEDRFGMRQRVASEDTIRNFCNGIGDVNPLYRSRDNAKNNIHGSLMAPPHFLHAIAFQGGLQRRQLDCVTSGFYAGNRAEWFKTIRQGDEFTVFSVPNEVKDITREGTALQFLSSDRTVYKNQKNEIAAVFTSSNIIFADPGEGDKVSVKRVRRAPNQRHWSKQEIEEWYDLIEQEEIRGGEPRYWEDVTEGDQLPPTHHFFTAAQAIAFFSGCSWFEDWRFRVLEAKAGTSHGMGMIPDPETGIPELSDPWWHMFDHVAQREGMDRAFCPGRLMECWLGNLITNWMSDAGFLKKMECQFRALLFSGSKVTCKGRIVNKHIENDEHLVDLQITLEDHEGVFPVPNGSATVVLPSREMGKLEKIPIWFS